MSMPSQTKPEATIGTRAALAHSKQWFRQNPAAVLLISLVLVFVSSPFEELMRDGDLVESLRLSVVVVSALLTVSRRRAMVLWGVILVAPAVVGKWVNHWYPEQVPDSLFLAPAVLFVVFVIAHLLRFILRAPRVNSEVLCTGISAYLLLGMLWALAYMLVARLVPGSFAFSTGTPASQVMKGFTAIYYSFITLCTVGYGDIAPVSGAARMLAMMESIVGVFYTAILVARLVTLYSSSAPPDAAAPEQRP